MLIQQYAVWVHLYINISILSTEHPEIPSRMGTINNVEKFDADFFGSFFEQAQAFSPETRLLEHSYEAVIDTGFNPKELRGKNTAVIIGNSYIETQINMLYEEHQVEKLIIDKYNKKK